MSGTRSARRRPGATAWDQMIETRPLIGINSGRRLAITNTPSNRTPLPAPPSAPPPTPPFRSRSGGGRPDELIGRDFAQPHHDLEVKR